MSTGDIKNNLRKLQTELRKVKYIGEVDLEGITAGVWQAFEPIYRYAFGSFSSAIADEINEKLNFQLVSRVEHRFHEGLYRLLRDLYKYKPPVTKDQFASTGFAERKIIMCTEILQMVQTRQNEITGRFSRLSQSSTNDSVRDTTRGPHSVRGGDTVSSLGSKEKLDSDRPKGEDSDIMNECDVLKEPDEKPNNNEAITFWEFQKAVEKNFNKMLGRMTILESRMVTLENKMESLQIFHDKDHSAALEQNMSLEGESLPIATHIATV